MSFDGVMTVPVFGRDSSRSNQRRRGVETAAGNGNGMTTAVFRLGCGPGGDQLSHAHHLNAIIMLAELVALPAVAWLGFITR